MRIIFSDMKFFRINIYSLFFCLLLITTCNDSGKNEKQNNTEVSNDTLSTSTKSTFLFLTEWFNKVGVYKYDLINKKYKPVWWHPRENVVMLIYKPGKFPSYFLTSEKIETNENIPSFFGLKLFIISEDISETKQIDYLGDGIQFTARWNEDENLELIFTSVDKTIASYINQYTKVYDHYGKLIDSDVKTFDIQKSGFPQLVPPRNSTISPSGKYGISFKGDSLFIKTANSDSAELVSIMKQNLNKLNWGNNEKYLIVSTLDLDHESIQTKNPETSELFIYSLEADSLIGVFSGTGLKNFFTIDDLLIFDNGFTNNSSINIYDMRKMKIIDVIKPREGCGLVVIPKL